jgi:hypothetical protein
MLAVYRRCLRLYPAAFRSRFADEMLQSIRDRQTFDRRVRWAGVFGDLFLSAVVQRTKESTDMKTKLGVLLFVIVAVGGGSMLVTGTSFGRESFMVTLVVLVAIGAVLAVATLIGKSRAGAEYDYSKRRLHWWWVPAAVVGAAELLVGFGQLIDDPKPENVFALAIMLGFAGLVFGGMALRNRIAGNWMIATGALPMVPWFWMVWPPIVGLVVIVMALADNVRMSKRPRVAA